MKFKKLLAVALSCAMVMGVAGCGGSEEAAPAEGEAAEETAESTEGETKVIVDHAGNEVTIPANPERIAILSVLPLPSVYCMFRGSTEGLVGMPPSAMAAAKNSYLATVFPEIVDIDTSFAESEAVNIEQLMALEPDLVFYNAASPEDKEMLEAAGLTAVGFSVTLADHNTIETYATWIDLLGQIFGESEKADAIIEYGRSVEAEIKEKVAEIPEEDKPRVLILFNYDNGKIKTSGSHFFGQYWIDTAGGVNVAKDLERIAEINMEQIYEWNPDMIFITNFSPVLPEDLYDNTIEGHDWSQVKAVQDHKVYKFPLGMYRWFPPSSDTPLSLMWLAKQMQPEVFDYIDLDQEIKDYYKEYYKVELTDDDLQDIYHPAREASGK